MIKGIIMPLNKILSFLGSSQNGNSSADKKFLYDGPLEGLIKALPYVTCILNEDRKVMFSRPVGLDNGQQITVEELFGHHPGQALNCLHATMSKEICHNDGVCRYCGLPNAIVHSEITGEKSEQETTITVVGSERTMTYDIRVTAIPFRIGNRNLTLLVIADISETKRKKVLERIFFHDILNKTGSLSGIMNLLNESEDPGEKKELLELSEDILKDLNEEILLQKQLMAAESGELVINLKEASAADMLVASVEQTNKLTEGKKIHIRSESETGNTDIVTDPVLVKRILINMLKNAMEATTSGQRIEAGVQSDDQHIFFWVYNDGVIPRSVQIQLFSRNFSTKGEHRGLGTYSMRLLGESYLGGRVYFESHGKGTTFFFKLPRKI